MFTDSAARVKEFNVSSAEIKEILQDGMATPLTPEFPPIQDWKLDSSEALRLAEEYGGHIQTGGMGGSGLTQLRMCNVDGTMAPLWFVPHRLGWFIFYIRADTGRAVFLKDHERPLFTEIVPDEVRKLSVFRPRIAFSPPVSGYVRSQRPRSEPSKLPFVLACILALIAVGTVLYFKYGGKSSAPEQSSTDTSIGNANAVEPMGSPEDYFPMQPGTMWTYKITVTDKEPLTYREVIWPIGDQNRLVSTRGRLLPGMERKAKEFTLVIRAESTAAQQGGLHYPLGTKLEIVRDDLRVFEGHKDAFFAARTSGGFAGFLVITYPPGSPGSMSDGPWGEWGAEDGYSMRLMFFGDNPGTEIGLGQKPADHLLFIGPESLSGYNAPALHFKRTVDQEKEDQDSEDQQDNPGSLLLHQGFTEDSWFVPGRGMVKLIQARDDQVTMSWELTNFSAAGGP